MSVWKLVSTPGLQPLCNSIAGSKTEMILVKNML